MILISIITVTYNDHVGLVSTIESVGNLASKLNFEHVIIDGSSSDDTIMYLSSYIKKPYISTKFLSESDKGIYDAMNKGVQFAKGEFCFFLNSGDLFDPDAKLTELFEVLSSEKDLVKLAGFAFNVRIMYGKYSRLVKSRNIRLWNLRMPTIHQGILYKTDYLRNYPYNDNLKICSDFKSVLSALESGFYFSPKDINFTVLSLGGVSTMKPFHLMKESSRIIFKTRFHLINKISSILLIFSKIIIFQIFFHTIIRIRSK